MSLPNSLELGFHSGHGLVRDRLKSQSATNQPGLFLPRHAVINQGNRKIAFTVKTSAAIRSRQVGRNVAHMEKVLNLA